MGKGSVAMGCMWFVWTARTAVRSVSVGMDEDDADGMGDIGTGSTGVGGMGDMGVYGLVCVRVASVLPWTQEVTFPRASVAAFGGDDHTSLSRDSRHVLVDTGKGLLSVCRACVSELVRTDIPGCPC